MSLRENLNVLGKIRKSTNFFLSLPEKCSNAELFLVQIPENMDQKLFTQCVPIKQENTKIDKDDKVL